jgi:DNA-directed RNA polymerase II subunit RPB1
MDDLSLLLSLESEQVIRAKSVVSITLASTTDHGKPKTLGLMDSRMGSTDRALLCLTCQKPNCAGHFGMIEFPYHIYLVGHLKRIVALLRCVCSACLAPLFSKDQLQQWNIEDLKRTERLRAVAEKCRSKSGSECENCSTPIPEYSEINRIFIKREFSPESLASMVQEERDFYSQNFTAEEAYSILDKISHDTLEDLGILPEISHPRDTIPLCIQVLPPAQRPTLRIADCGKARGEDDLTVIYQDIVRAKSELELKLSSAPEGLQNPSVYQSYCKLQLMVACIGNPGLRKIVVIPGVSDHSARGMVRVLNGLHKRLSGKTGRFRSSLGANRTDFSARTVVGIDMCKDIWMLGVPQCRMKVLTEPVTVNDINMEELQLRIMKGSTGEGGANYVLQPQSGSAPRMISLALMNYDQRCALAASLRVGWIVERHLQKGDWVWFNRQPTLHRMNMIAFQIYPVPGLTFRLPLPCTRPFNADYDGDEMNLHVPQTIEAKAEAAMLMNVAENMISPSSTTTIIALVQESLVAWYRLTSRNVLLTRDSYMQILAQIDHCPNAPNYAEHPCMGKTEGSIYISQPAILKSPKGPRWTGKQILKSLLPSSLTLLKVVRDGDMKSTEEWVNERENVVVIKHGELLLGKLCKATLGSGPSLVHILWKDISPWAAAKFVSDAQRIGNAWNAVDSMCVGIRECLVSQDTEDKVSNLVAECMGKVDAVATTQFPEAVKEARISSLLQDVLRESGALVIKHMNPANTLPTLAACGAKGTQLNLAQIMGILGQQSIGGARVQHMDTRLGKRGLLCFKPGDTTPEAKGFIATSFVMGQTPPEFFHAAMAGREGIVTTAVETANTGYNQRKMVKMSEGEVVANDGTVRVTSNDIVSLSYGGDGYDAIRLERVKMNSFLYMSNDALADLLGQPSTQNTPKTWEFYMCWEARRILRKYCEPCVPGEYAQQLCLPFQPLRINDSMLDIPPETPFTPTQHSAWMLTLLLDVITAHYGPERRARKMNKTEALQKLRVSVLPSWGKSVAIILLSWNSYFFHRNAVGKERSAWLHHEILSKIRTALVSPGEAVGTVGATSIGEPSTQGALNTFHFSGIAEKNGTTGAKRFKEIIGNAYVPETCVMHCLVDNEQEAKDLAQTLKAVKFSDVVKTSTILLTSQTTRLQQREKSILSWVHSWITPLGSVRQINVSRLEATKHQSHHCIEFLLRKSACFLEHLTPAQCADRIRRALLDTCLVTFSQEFDAEWTIRILPLPCDQFLNSSGSFASLDVCEAILDAFLGNSFLVSGLEGISETFHLLSKVDGTLPNGGIGKISTRKVGTVGADLKNLAWKLQDSSKLWTNDIHQTEEFLGIEAAVQMINSELQRALSVDSYVDPRHTLLLTETMTRCGTVSALNRNNMENLGASTLACAAFERTLPVLEEAAFYGLRDPLRGSLERQILGLPLRVGTGIVHVVSGSMAAPRQSILAPLAKKDKSQKPEVISALLPVSKVAFSSFEEDLHITIKPLGGFTSGQWTPYVSAPLSPFLERPSKDLSALANFWYEALTSSFDTFILRIQLKSTESELHTIAAKLQEYLGWDNPLECNQWIQSSEVVWASDEKFEMCSISNLANSSSTGKSLKFHIQKSVAGQRAIDWQTPMHGTISQHKTIASDLIPDTIIPQKIRIRQRCSLIKDGWTYCLQKLWEASSIMECEVKVLSEPPKCTVRVSVSNRQASQAFPSLHVEETLVAKLYSCIH